MFATFFVSVVPIWETQTYIKVVYHSWFKDRILYAHPKPEVEIEENAEEGIVENAEEGNGIEENAEEGNIQEDQPQAPQEEIAAN